MDGGGVDIRVVITRYDGRHFTLAVPFGSGHGPDPQFREKVSRIRQYRIRVRGEQLPRGTDNGRPHGAVARTPAELRIPVGAGGSVGGAAVGQTPREARAAVVLAVATRASASERGHAGHGGGV